MQALGPSYRTGLRQRLRDLLADGDWHSLGSLAFETTDIIRPETAWRWHSSHEMNAAKQAGRPPRILPMDEAISRGRMGIIAQALRDMKVEQTKQRAGSQSQFRLRNLVRSRSTTYKISAPETPEFDGGTIDPVLDDERLGRQLRRVRDMMRDTQWRTLGEIASQTGDPESSISARLRDLRKPKFGGWDVQRRRRGDPKLGLFEYRLLAAEPERAYPVVAEQLEEAGG